MIVGIPGEQEANKKEKNECQGRKEKEKEGFALEQQTPVKIFVPGGVDPSQEVAQAETVKRKAREADVREALIIINREIAGDAAGSLSEYGGILQLLAGKRVPLRIAEDNPKCRIDDNPAAIDEHFGDHVLGSTFGREQQETASGEAGAAGEIQESIGGGAANGKQLAVIQSGFGIADGEFVKVRSEGTWSTTADPSEDGIDFFFRRSWTGNDGVREALEIAAHGIFPSGGITDE